MPGKRKGGGGMACANFPRGVEFGALSPHLCLHILKKRDHQYSCVPS